MKVHDAARRHGIMPEDAIQAATWATCTASVLTVATTRSQNTATYSPAQESDSRRVLLVLGL